MNAKLSESPDVFRTAGERVGGDTASVHPFFIIGTRQKHILLRNCVNISILTRNEWQSIA